MRLASRSRRRTRWPAGRRSRGSLSPPIRRPRSARPRARRRRRPRRASRCGGRRARRSCRRAAARHAADREAVRRRRAMRTPIARSASVTVSMRSVSFARSSSAPLTSRRRRARTRRAARRAAARRRAAAPPRPRSRVATSGCASDLDVADGSPATVPRVEARRRARPSARARRGARSRRGLRPTSWTVSCEPGSSAAATRNGAADEMSPGTCDLGQPQPLGPASTRDRAPASASTRAPAAREHQLGVVARRRRLDHRRRPASRRARRAGSPTSPARSRPAARSSIAVELAALDARAAGGRRSPRSPRPSAAAARRPAPSAGARATRRRRARSGPAWKARMPHDEPRERAGVAAVDRRRRARAARAGRRRGRRACRRPPRRPRTPSARDGGERRLGVAGAAPAADARLALAERAEQQRAVRDRLVARDGDVAVDVRGGLDLHAPPRSDPTRRRVAGRAARRSGRPRPCPAPPGAPPRGSAAPFWNGSGSKSLHLSQLCNFSSTPRCRGPSPARRLLIEHRGDDDAVALALEQLGRARAPRPRR